MNMIIKNLGLAAGVLLMTTNTFGQKKNETSAAVERGKALIAMQKQDVDEAIKFFLSAKKYIDLAEAHVDTKERQKTLWLVGDIYSQLVVLGEAKQDKDLIASLGGSKEAMTRAQQALKKAFPKGKKHKDDIIGTVDQNRIIMNKMANINYKSENYTAAADFYAGQASFADCIDMIDTNAIYNAAISYDKAEQYSAAIPMYLQLAELNHNGTQCYVLASAAYRKTGDIDRAKALISEAREANPTDKDLLLEVVNTSIEEGDAAGAEKALAGAIDQDPNNKQLHYTIGTIMIDLGNKAFKAQKADGVSSEDAAAHKATGNSYFEKAEASLQKALDIDPDYVDAQYQLGAHLVEWAGAINTEASKVDPDDRLTYEVMKAKSKQTYSKALAPLEKYIASYPNDKAVLTILFQIHRSLGDSAKALEYKKRADAAE